VSRSSQASAIHRAVGLLDHPTADEVFMHVRRREARVSIGTVYRNLDRLVADGRLRVRQIGGQRRYDSNTATHAHLHCTRCDRLIDIPWRDEEGVGLHPVVQELGFRVEDQILELQGMCAACQKTEAMTREEIPE
jgi:Fe2+ or Zn2+ uptake regulation protein